MSREVRVYVQVKDHVLTEVVEAARAARSTLEHPPGCGAFMKADNRRCTCGVGQLLRALDAVERDKAEV